MFDVDPAVRSRAVRLLDYLDAIRRLREVPVRDVAEYRDKHWWAGDIPDHPSCVVSATEEVPWLRVSKAQVPPVPGLPADIALYLQGDVAEPGREPALVADFENQFSVDPGGLAEAARVRGRFREYVEGPWRDWAGVASAALAARELYDELFELRMRLQRESAQIELVWGYGILSWGVNGSRVVHPLVTTQVQLTFDTDTGSLAVEPEALAAPRLEIDLLQGLDLTGFSLLADVRDGFRADPIGPFSPQARALYERLLAPLGQDGSVIDVRQPAAPGPAPMISATWGLLVRRRSTMYQRFFGELRDGLSAGQLTVPAPLGAIVADAPSKLDQAPAETGGDEASWQKTAQRLLMPLPTNPEQERVARRLAEHRGVTVQGPPGTGKTHTIANLISHLVGHGKRVLVTSQKEQALDVLRDKIPAEIRDLSVAVLGSSSASMAQLDQSAQAIYGRAWAIDRPAARERIAALGAELTQAQRDIGSLRTRIAESIARERDEYVAGGTTHTPSTLGRWLAAEEARLGYIPDEIAPGIGCPLTATDFTELFRLARELPLGDRVRGRLRVPPAADLPSGAGLASAGAELAEIRDKMASTEAAVRDPHALERLDEAELADLLHAVEQAAAQLVDLEQPWLRAIRSESGNPAFAAFWQAQLHAIQEGISLLAAWQSQLSGRAVSLPGDGLPSRELLDQLVLIRERSAAGKGVSKAFQRGLYEVRESCGVDGEPPRRADDIELCITEVRSRRLRHELIRRWNDAAARIGGPLLDEASPHPEFKLSEFETVLDSALAWEQVQWSALQERLRAAGLRVLQTADSAELTALAGTVATISLRAREKELAAQFAAMGQRLAGELAQPDASDIWLNLHEAFAARAWDKWDGALNEARRVNTIAGDVARFDALASRLAVCAPEWAGQISQSQGEETVTGVPGTAAQAWEWRAADSWLRLIASADDPATMQGQLEMKLQKAAKVTGELAAESAWLALGERMTDAERAALVAWVDAVRRIGKGTGKHAGHYRAQAQRAMREALTAVPVWIMPTHRVVESFGAAMSRFDVVIVDESSQCDLFGLAALSLADKAVIVGDDKQISPSAIGTDESQVHRLIAEHIPDVPQAAMLDIKSSLYDVAKMRFPGVIMLREHFRCLPEIIAFSNNLSYNGEILPLREQPADATWQSVLDVHLPDGFRDPGTDTNEAEATYIADKIAELCGDTRYQGKTFGVISMLGVAQAAKIEELLIVRLGEKKFEQRKIRCGNAYHFQGDERDIMFVSLVVATGEGRRIGAMTKNADRQRMNVAASRARDQMWCIRSVVLDELHPDDVRALFIRHCQNPALVEEASAAAEASFDSDFERDVYRRVVARGYRAITQYRVGNYRIDLVIQGAQGRLAVELDGDAYHGPDRWDADRQRQAILERLGWTFHRIRGSAYYRDRDAALSTLWDRLEYLDIRPASEDTSRARLSPAGPPPAAVLAPSPTGDSLPPRSPMPCEAPMTAISGTPSSMPEWLSGFPSSGAATAFPASKPASALEAKPELSPASSSGPQTPALPDWMRSRLEASSDVPVAPEGQRAPTAAQEIPANPGPARQTPGTRGLPEQETVAAAADVAGQAGVQPLRTIQPHRPWTPHPLPKIEDALPSELIALVVEIVAAEGPVVTDRLYSLCAAGWGKTEFSPAEQASLAKAIARGIREGVIRQVTSTSPDDSGETLYLTGTSAIVLRTLGDRQFSHVPVSELASAVAALLNLDGSATNEDLTYLLAATYGKDKLTERERRHARHAIAQARKATESAD